MATVERTLSDFAAEQALPLTRFAYLMCGDHGSAEDLVQDTFLALYRRFGDRLRVDNPVAYARTAITHAYISASRRRSTGELPTDDLPEPTLASADPSDRDLMWRALAVLPRRQRAVLVLRYYLDVPDQAIAHMLDCRRGTIRSLASRAIATLRTHPSFTEESR